MMFYLCEIFDPINSGCIVDDDMEPSSASIDRYRTRISGGRKENSRGGSYKMRQAVEEELKCEPEGIIRTLRWPSFSSIDWLCGWQELEYEIRFCHQASHIIWILQKAKCGSLCEHIIIRISRLCATPLCVNVKYGYASRFCCTPRVLIMMNTWRGAQAHCLSRPKKLLGFNWRWLIVSPVRVRCGYDAAITYWCVFGVFGAYARDFKLWLRGLWMNVFSLWQV